MVSALATFLAPHLTTRVAWYRPTGSGPSSGWQLVAAQVPVLVAAVEQAGVPLRPGEAADWPTHVVLAPPTVGLAVGDQVRTADGTVWDVVASNGDAPAAPLRVAQLRRRG